MRIAYILGRFPVLSETFIGEEIRALEARGHSVTLFALHPGNETAQPEDAALARRTRYFSPIDPLASRSLLRRYAFAWPRLLPFLCAQTTEPLWPLAVHAAWLAEQLRAEGVEHVHAHFAWGAATYAIAAAKLLKLPVSFTCHGSDIYARPQDAALKCRSASWVVAVTPGLAEYIKAMTPGVRCHVVYCGVDARRFQPLSGGQVAHDRWLFVGRLVECKGLDDIVQAWAQLPADSRPPLDIVGDGPLSAALQQRIAALGLSEHIACLGARTSEWICEHGPRYRAFISAYTQGSDGSRDTSPVALKEAMAMGLPVVTTAFGDINLLVGEQAAILSAPDSPAALAAAVLSIEGMTENERRAMGEAGRQRVLRHFTSDSQAQQLEALFLRGRRG